MISLEEALRRIDAAVKPLPPKMVRLLEAVGCCTAREMVSGIDVPGFASSAMDGIAVAFAEIESRGEQYPVRLSLQGVIPAGQVAPETLKPRHAYRIMTGAPLPKGADTVVPVEDLKFDGDAVEILVAMQKGQHVRPAGNDVKAGQVIFRKSHLLKPVDTGICAGLGMTEVEAHPQPSVAVLATGSEICPLGGELLPGQIYNSNDTTLRALLKHGGFGDPGELPPLRDDLETLIPALEKLCNQYDVVITSGAVSAGEFDYIPKVIDALKGDLLFHKVAIKPGKPALIARIGQCWLVSLPGNPVSVVVTFHLYAKRVLRRLRGDLTPPLREKAVLEKDVKVESDRFYILGAYLERTEAGLMARGCERYESGRLSSIKGIDGFMFLEAGNYTLAAGTAVEVDWL